mmetsp:Transcript_21715/g.71839  ORF Transcript_21715/g.71839 Transcript_21715/m.71839 type:complete len:413 (-) Transcript_21715:52-1290(-)
MNESTRMEARAAHRHDHSSHAVLSYSGQESNHIRKINQASKLSGSNPVTKKSASNISVIQGPHHHTPNSQYGSPSSKIQVSVLNNSAPPTSVSFSSTNNSSKYFVGSIIQAFKDGNWRTVRIEASRMRSSVEEVRVSYLGGALGLPPEWIPTSSGLLRPIPTTPKQSAWHSSHSKNVSKNAVATSQAFQSVKHVGSKAGGSTSSHGYSMMTSNGFGKSTMPGAPALSSQAEDSWKDPNQSRLWGAAAALRGTTTANGMSGDAWGMKTSGSSAGGMNNGMNALSLQSNLSALLGKSPSSHGDLNLLGSSSVMGLSSAMPGKGPVSSQSGSLLSFLSSVEDKESGSRRALIDAMLPSPFSASTPSISQFKGSLGSLLQQQPPLSFNGVGMMEAGQHRSRDLLLSLSGAKMNGGT